MAVELKVPEVGESITDVVIGQWSVQEGGSVGKESPVVEIETDKITLELPAPVDGKVTQILKKQGEEAQVGDIIGYMEEGEAPADSGGGDEAAKSEPAASSTPEPAADKPAASEPAPTPQGDSNARIMPAAQRLIEENNLNPAAIPATGPGGRILKEDVQNYLESNAGGTAEAAPASRLEDVVPMTPLRKRIAERLVEAQQTAALLTTFNEIDMTSIMALRSKYKETFAEKYGVKLGFMSFFVKAAIDALKAYPSVNAEIRDQSIVYRNYFDIGIAVGSGKGLVVPVLRDAERMSFAEVELAISDFAKRIRANKIKLDELTGGTFTITNGGVYGSLLSTPIINPPQSGVLGMHGIFDRPIAINGEAVVRPMMYVALTYDHRLVDGREAVSFLVRMKQTLEDPTRMLMEI